MTETQVEEPNKKAKKDNANLPWVEKYRPEKYDDDDDDGENKTKEGIHAATARPCLTLLCLCVPPPPQIGRLGGAR